MIHLGSLEIHIVPRIGQFGVKETPIHPFNQDVGFRKYSFTTSFILRQMLAVMK
jgi:hypothetical protein